MYPSLQFVDLSRELMYIFFTYALMPTHIIPGNNIFVLSKTIDELSTLKALDPYLSIVDKIHKFMRIRILNFRCRI